MGDSIRLAECFNTTVRDAYDLPKKDAVLVMWRDFDERRKHTNRIMIIIIIKISNL